VLNPFQSIEILDYSGIFERRTRMSYSYTSSIFHHVLEKKSELIAPKLLNVDNRKANSDLITLLRRPSDERLKAIKWERERQDSDSACG